MFNNDTLCSTQDTICTNSKLCYTITSTFLYFAYYCKLQLPHFLQSLFNSDEDGILSTLQKLKFY